jgi:hypothetical protein
MEEEVKEHFQGKVQEVLGIISRALPTMASRYVAGTVGQAQK